MISAQTTPGYIGIDVAKTTLDVAVRPTGAFQTFANTPDGRKTLAAWLQPLIPTLIVLEATGGLERPVVAALTARGHAVAIINPRHGHALARATGQLAKTDRLDAHMLAHFAEAVRPTPRPQPSEAQQTLQALERRYQQLLTMRTMDTNRRHSTTEPVCQASITAHLTWLTEQLTALETQIAAQIRLQPALVSRKNLLCSMTGIGDRTAHALIATLPELGTIGRRTIAALTGLAPFNCDSGGQQKRRRIWGGRAPVRKALYMATLSASRHNAVIRALYTRLCERGKPKKVAIVACMRKLLVILNAIVRTQTAWDVNFATKTIASS